MFKKLCFSFISIIGFSLTGIAYAVDLSQKAGVSEEHSHPECITVSLRDGFDITEDNDCVSFSKAEDSIQLVSTLIGIIARFGLI